MSGDDAPFTRLDFPTLEPVPNPEMKVGDTVTILENDGVARFEITAVEPTEPDDEDWPAMRISLRAV